MKSVIFLLVILFGVQFKAQQVYPFGYSNIPKYSYSKDTENILAPYIGTWKGYFNGKTIIIVLNKEEKVLDEETLIYRDKLVIRYEVRGKNGEVLESTLGKVFYDKSFKIEAWIFRDDIHKMMGIFYGGICGLGRGFVYLSPPNGNRMTWSYKGSVLYLTKDMVDKCPGEVHLPEGEDLVFIKQ